MKSLIKLIFGNDFFDEEKPKCNFQKSLNVYKQEFEIDQYFILSESYDIYYYSKYSYKIPEKILKKFKNKTVIWLDSGTNLLGFSNQQHCLLFPINGIEKFIITNIPHSKTYGESFLSIKLFEEKHKITLVNSVPNEFDEYAGEIKNISKIDVVFETF